MDGKDGWNPAWPMNDRGIHPDPIHPFLLPARGSVLWFVPPPIIFSAGFLFLRILSCSQSDDSSRKWFSQNWLYTRYEIRKKKKSFYVLGYLLELIIKIWRFGIHFSFKIWLSFLNLSIHKCSFCVPQWASKLSHAKIFPLHLSLCVP